MKTNVTEYDFFQAFVDMNRESNFTSDGCTALFKYLEQLGSDTGEEVELDVIALCCEYTEYENLADLQDSYDIDNMTTLAENTTVIYIDDPPEYDDDTVYDGRFIIQDY